MNNNSNNSKQVSTVSNNATIYGWCYAKNGDLKIVSAPFTADQVKGRK